MKSRVFFIRPVQLVSPSGEVTVTLEDLPGRQRWVVEVRGISRDGRSMRALPAAFQDLAAVLRESACGEAAGELERLAAGLASG